METMTIIEAAIGESSRVLAITGPEDGTFEVIEHLDLPRGTVRLCSVMSLSALRVTLEVAGSGPIDQEQPNYGNLTD